MTDEIEFVLPQGWKLLISETAQFESKGIIVCLNEDNKKVYFRKSSEHPNIFEILSIDELKTLNIPFSVEETVSYPVKKYIEEIIHE